MKKVVIFATIISALLLFNCKDKTLPNAGEKIEETEVDSIVVKDGVKTNEVTSVVAKKDSVAIHPKK